MTIETGVRPRRNRLLAGVLASVCLGISVLGLAQWARPWLPEELFLLGAEDGVVDYGGAFLGDPRLTAVASQLAELRRNALARAERGSGLTAAAPGRILVGITDGATERRTTDITTRLGYRPIRIVSLYAEPIVFQARDTEDALTEEMVGALLLDRGRDELPDWFRVGAAVWAAGRVEARCARVFAERIARGEQERAPGSWLNGLATRPRRSSDFCEDALAFALVEDRGGRDRVVQFIRDVVDGGNARVALESALDRRWRQIPKELSDFAARRMGGFVPLPEREAFREARRAFEEEELEIAVASLAGFETRFPDSALIPYARLLAGRAWLGLHRYQDALRQFTPVLDSGELAVAGEAKLLLARTYRLAGEHRRAVTEYEDLRRHFGFASAKLRADARFEQGNAYFALRQWGDAVTAYREALAEGTEDAEDARFMLGATEAERGDRARAIDAFETFLELHPDSERGPFARERLARLKRGV